jgi:hypothetical protein
MVPKANSDSKRRQMASNARTRSLATLFVATENIATTRGPSLLPAAVVVALAAVVVALAAVVEGRRSRERRWSRARSTTSVKGGGERRTNAANALQDISAKQPSRANASIAGGGML